MSELIIGATALNGADASRMRQAGIRWIRHGYAGCDFPFVDRIGGELTEAYLRTRAQTRAWSAAGLQIVGVTPTPFVGRYVPGPDGRLVMVTPPRLPDWFGEPGSAGYIRSYEELCRWLADDLHDCVRIWQIANELDIGLFAGPLNPDQACELILAGARGLKRADGGLLVGHNMADSDRAASMAGRLYGRKDGLLDYAGIDGYYGTWKAGGPASWASCIRKLHEQSKLPVMVNEWGFSSTGQVESEPQGKEFRPPCEKGKWRFTWGPGHNPEGQAAFVAEAFEAFRFVRDALLGVLFYRWEDQTECWQCGRADCPIETAWGLVDRQGRPKPALDAFRRGAAALRGEA